MQHNIHNAYNSYKREAYDSFTGSDKWKCLDIFSEKKFQRIVQSEIVFLEVFWGFVSSIPGWGRNMWEVVKSTSLSQCSCSVSVIVINQNCQKRGHFRADPQFFQADMLFFCYRIFSALHHLHKGPSCHVTTRTKMASSSQGDPPTAKKPITGPFSKKGRLKFYWNINL